MKDNKNDKEKIEKLEEKIKLAEKNFKEVMETIKPFIKKSNIYIISTEGKWRDTSSVSDKVITQK